MGAVELRNTIIEKVQDADERLLAVINAVLDSYQESEVVAYDVDGSALNRAQYEGQVREAEAQFKSGQFITQEDMEKSLKD